MVSELAKILKQIYEISKEVDQLGRDGTIDSNSAEVLRQKIRKTEEQIDSELNRYATPLF